MVNKRKAADEMTDQRTYARSRGVRIPKTSVEIAADAEEVDRLALQIMGLLAKGTRLQLRQRALQRAGKMLGQTGKRPGQNKT